MTIATYDGLVSALGNTTEVAISIKPVSVANQVVGGYYSYWLHAGIPVPPSAPTTAAICSKATSGAIRAFPDLSGSDQLYLGLQSVTTSLAGNGVQLHDRLAHMGGLSGTSTGSQTVNLDVTGSSSNLTDRKGASDYSDVRWWFEVYTAIGTTAATLTITYTNAAGTSGQTLAITVGNSATNGRYPGNMRPLAFPGGCQSIQTAQLGVSTGTAGDFGFCATRYLTSTITSTANRSVVFDWAASGLPRIHEHACLSTIQICGSTSSGTLFSALNLARG